MAGLENNETNNKVFVSRAALELLDPSSITYMNVMDVLEFLSTYTKPGNCGCVYKDELLGYISKDSDGRFIVDCLLAMVA